MGQVHFIIGAPSTGKSYQILNEIKEKCLVQRVEDPIFILTPEQMTFHTEYQLLLMGEVPSMIRANVLSFNRLAHRVMQEVGGLSRHHLDEIGKSMLLQKMMTSQKHELGIYANYTKKPGFIQKMDELFSEFKHYQLDTKRLKELLTDPTLMPQTRQKMRTFIDLYDQFTQVTLTHYLTTEDYFTRLHAQISQSEWIKKAEIYMDGYHTFNPQEQLIIQQLARHAKKITITLTFDPNSTSPLYETTRSTFVSLTAKCAEIGINPSFSKLDESQSRVWVSQASAHLKTAFMQSEMPYTGSDGIAFFSAGTKRMELEEVAKRIHQLAYEAGESYSNIAVYSANPIEDYRLYEAIFTKHNIPYFLDYKEAMLSHPVISLLHQVFDIFTSHWHNQALFNVVKTGLFVNVTKLAKGVSYEDVVNRHLEDVDLLENYVQARPIKKHHWLSGEEWIYKRSHDGIQTTGDLKKQTVINSVKQKIVLPLITLEAKLKDARTIHQFATCVFEFLEHLAIPQKKLQLLAESAGLRGKMKEKKQHEQVWAKLLSLLEQVVEVAGEDEILLADFIQIMKVGLEQMTYATIPAALDGVQIGSVKRSRYQLSTHFSKPADYGIQHAFITGLNEGILPATPAESSLLTERDREALARIGCQLAPSFIQSQQDEVFSLYTILAAAKASITLSHITENGASPSHVWTHLQQIFPDAAVRVVTVDEMYDRLTTSSALFSQVLLDLQQHPENRAYSAPILQYYQQADPLKFALIHQALGYENGVCQLEGSVTKDIYGEEMKVSVSRIERFNHCEFAHFLHDGLRLRPREVAQLRMPEIGNLYHEMLKYISTLIHQEGQSFASLTDSECKRLVEMGINDLQHQFAFSVLTSSPRMQALKNKLVGVVYQTLLTLSKQGKQSAFKEHLFEWPFGPEPTDMIKTKQSQVGDFKFSLRGIIDRIDVAQSEDRLYVRVVDYKSSKKELELDAVYYGLSLQLLTYLDVVISGASEPSAIGGALYFHVHRPYTSYHSEILTSETMVDELLAWQAKEQKMTGYLPENHDVARMSDAHLGVLQTASDVVPITLKKDGQFAAKGNRVLCSSDFDMLREFTNHQIEKSVAKMTSGHVAINPVKYQGQTACDWCPFKSICQFEAPYHHHQNLPKLKPDEAIAKMRSVLADDDDPMG